MFNWLKKLFAPPIEHLPQLEMFRDHLNNLPEIQKITGYTTRTYCSGDETAWCRIMEGNVGNNWTTREMPHAIDPRSPFPGRKSLFHHP